MINRNTLRKIHAAAGAGAFLFIASFWSSTVLSELFGSHETVAAVKQTIVYVLCGLNWGSDIFCIGRLGTKKWPQSFNDGDYGHFLIRKPWRFIFPKTGQKWAEFWCRMVREWMGVGKKAEKMGWI